LITATQVLGSLPGKPAQDTLMQLLSHKNSVVRSTAETLVQSMDAKAEAALMFTLKHEWVLPSEGNFQAKLGALFQAGVEKKQGEDAEFDIKVAGEASIIVYGRSFQVIELGLSIQETGIYAKFLGIAFVLKELFPSSEKKSPLKKFVEKKAQKLSNLAEGAASIMGNAANPNEDEQGRCRTDMSGRTNELNPEYQGMKGSVKDEKKWTLWRTIMMTPIGIPIELKIEAVLGYGLDFGIGSGGDGQVKTCMKAKLPNGKCPEKSSIVQGSGDTAGKTGSAQDVVIGPDGNCMLEHR